MIFNRQILEVEPSKSVTLLARTKELQKTDHTIINMTGGEPDFPTPKPICDEITRQLAAGYTHYTDSKGDPDLRRRISRKLTEENHAPFQPDQILITPGAKYAVYLAIQALINPGDEAIWLTPGWVSYPSIVTLCGGTPVAVHLDYDDDYRITYDLLKAAVSEKTRLLILNYPNNPTGRILRPDDIAALKKFLTEYPEIVVVSDEIYEKVVFDGNEVISLASDPELFDRVIVINGFSKCSAMTGWRLGYLACESHLYAMILKVFQHSMSCTSGFLQKGALVALDCTDETEQMRAEYEKRRQILVDGISRIPGAEFISPAGAFYAWVKFDTQEDSETLCNRLLDEARIAGIPGSAYGEEKVCCVRFSFATSEDVIREMLTRLEQFMKNENHTYSEH